MTLSQRCAGDLMAINTVWLVWVLLAPITMGKHEIPKAKHVCPAPYVSHGVGSDLRTFAKPADRCRTYAGQ